MSRRGKGKRRFGRSRRSPGLWRKITVLAAAAIVIPLVAVSAWFVFFRSDEPPGPPRAAIVDQLSLTFPNPAFVQEATDTLQQAGYTVDYYPGEQVTVDFYRRLPVRNYGLIIFRTHADRIQGIWQGKQIDEVILFSSEPYNERKYLEDQAAKRLTIARYYEGGERYFGISPDFIEDRMLGKFDETTILMMGCEGLVSERTAEAFVQKGAKTYISWDETVSAAHTDAASERLLGYLLIEGLPAEEAVAQTMTEIGPDPTYGSVLLVYPSEG